MAVSTRDSIEVLCYNVMKKLYLKKNTQVGNSGKKLLDYLNTKYMKKEQMLKKDRIVNFEAILLSFKAAAVCKTSFPFTISKNN